MSSGDEDQNENGSQSMGQELKKRRIQRACDICRRKKIRCDGGQMPENRCSNCIAYNLECTYVEAAKKRGPPKGYVENLENRLESMEKLLRALCPDTDFTKDLGARIERENYDKDKGALQYDNNAAAGPSSSQNINVNPDDLPNSDDEMCNLSSTLTEGLKRLAVEPIDRRFLGKSSGVTLVRAAMDLKRESSGIGSSKDMLFPASRRLEFWTPRPWESIEEQHEVRFRYPPDDLIPELVNNYFSYLNPFLPVLHRPSFERALNDMRHHNDIGFGSVVMLVCALGARWSEDIRVLMDGMSKHSCGWKWFDQVQIHRKSFLGPPRLYDLQIFALSAIFLQSSSSPQSSWAMVGIGIRLAQDVGAHRKRVYVTPPTVESELWKRAFWVLVALDRFSSASLGRPCAIQDEDFDLDPPIEVDDEFWEHPDPSKQFKQPADIPPAIAYFTSFLKLCQILAFALRTIYSLNKSKILLGFVGPQWEQHIVSELDSELNKWIGDVPDHLRWDERRENFLHLSQSASLHLTYYFIQILIHRPFIPSPRKPSPLTFPSFAICTNAARSCSRIADVHRKRNGKSLPQTQVAVFTSAVVLLLNIWGARKSGSFADPQKHMEHVHKCMQVLRGLEDRWQSAGRLWDILNELASVGEIPLPDVGAHMYNKNKRERGSDHPVVNAPQHHLQQSSMMMGMTEPRPMAGRKSLVHPASIPSGLPFGTEQLAGLNTDMTGGSGMPLQWSAGTPTSAGSSQQGPPTAGGAYGGNAMGAAQSTAATTMPDINIFDMYNSEQMSHHYIPMMDQGYGAPPSTGSSSSSQHPQQQQSGQQQQAAMIPGNYMPMDPQMTAPMTEALNMWSAAPPTFDTEDWGSYLSSVGAGDSRQHSGA